MLINIKYERNFTIIKHPIIIKLHLYTFVNLQYLLKSFYLQLLLFNT